MTIANSLNMPEKKIFVAHVREMNMMCYCTPTPITTGIIQTIASIWVFLPTTLKREPLELMKGLVIGTIIITPAQEAALVIVIITEVVTASQMIMIAEAKIIMPDLENNQCPVLMACKTPTIMTANTSIVMVDGIGNRITISPTLLAQRRKFQQPPLIQQVLATPVASKPNMDKK